MGAAADFSPMKTVAPAPTPAKPACQCLTGYWINYRVNFRCYTCGHQRILRELPKNRNRRIETWTAS
jgi:hypothetical protein